MAVNSRLLDPCMQGCARVFREVLEATLGTIEPNTLYLTQGQRRIVARGRGNNNYDLDIWR
jgi:hypothetical protein